MLQFAICNGKLNECGSIKQPGISLVLVNSLTPPIPHKGGMKFLKNGANGGCKISTRNGGKPGMKGGWFYNGGIGNF